MFLLRLLLCVLALADPLTFRARLHDDLGTLDWGYGEVNGEIVYQLMEGLFRGGHDGQPRPAVAEAFHFNREKTELRLTLRDARWSDGAPVCAQQFVDAWDRLRDKAFASPFAHYAAPFESYIADGCKQLTIHFRRPTPEAPALLANLVFFPVRLDNLKAHPKAFLDGKDLLVNGPFRVADWQQNALLALERNPRYAGPAAALARVEFRFLPEDTTAKTMFELDQLDWVKEIPPLLRNPELERSGELRLFPSLIEYYFGLNMGRAPLLQDPAVRHALSAALDRREITKILGAECHGIDSWASALRPAPLRTSLGISAAVRAQLAAAAAKGELALALYTYSKSSHKLLAEWAQGQWEKKLGVRIPIHVEDAKVFWKEVGESPLPIFFGGVTAPYGHPRAFFQEFLKGGSANWTGWGTSEYDAAVNAEKFGKAESLLERDGFVIPLYRRDTVALVKKKWKGFFVNPLGQVYLGEVR